MKPNPNILARNEQALNVACGYCRAKVGESCWVVRNHGGQPRNVSHSPHRGRIKSAWREGFKERK
jgi:hypothetical protein